MLFTVNVETSGQPFSSPTRLLAPGYGVKSTNFIMNKGTIFYLNNLPHESETGREVIPGTDSLNIIIELSEKCIHVPDAKSTVILGYKGFSWPGHVYSDSPVYVQYTVDRVTPRLGCIDVNWLCELKDSDNKTACKLIIKQRVYTRP